MNANGPRPFVTRSVGVLTGALAGGVALAQASEEAAGAALGAALPSISPWVAVAPYYAAAAVMGIACIAAAYAVGKVGAAALAAAAEKPELLIKSIVLVGLGEGIAVFGLIISMLLIAKAA
jgi:V/A-type H+-transporting ATPase subunit K